MTHFQHLIRPGDSTKLLPNPTPQQRQRQFYMATVSMIDLWIGEIRAALGRRGLLENTVIIFTSDHGDTLTDHFSTQKWTMYDQVVRVPAIVWAPSRFPGGRHIQGLVEWFDLAATILDVAGAKFPEPFQAQSLLAALAGESFAGREYVFSEMGRWDLVGLSTDFMTMVRSHDFKLVHFVGQPHGRLFDLRNDPDELIHCWRDPAHASDRDHLIQAMTEWLIRSNCRAASWGANRRWPGPHPSPAPPGQAEYAVTCRYRRQSACRQWVSAHVPAAQLTRPRSSRKTALQSGPLPATRALCGFIAGQTLARLFAVVGIYSNFFQPSSKLLVTRCFGASTLERIDRPQKLPGNNISIVRQLHPGRGALARHAI